MSNIQTKLKPKLKYLFIFLVIFILFVSFVFMVPIGARTPISRFFDAIGMYELGLATTNPIKQLTSASGQSFYRLATMDASNPEECKELWPIVAKFGLEEKFSAGSFVLNTNFTLASTEYREVINLIGYLDARSSLTGPNAGGVLKFNFNLDPEFFINRLNEKPSTEDQQGVFYQKWLTSPLTAYFESRVVLDETGAYFKLDDLGAENQKERLDTNLGSWYGLKNNNELSQEGIVELAEIVKNYTTTKPGDMLSEETGREILKLSCQVNQNQESTTEVHGIQEVTLGNNLNSVTKTLRPVVTTQDINQNIRLDQENQKVWKLLAEDEVLKNWLLSQYEKVKSLRAAILKIEGVNPKEDSEYQNFTEEVWRSEVNTLFEDLQQIAENSDTTNLGISQQEINLRGEIKSTFYLTPAGDFYGFKQEFKIIPEGEFIDAVAEIGDFREVVKDGFVFILEMYDFKLNKDAKTLQRPSQSIDFEKFLEEFIETSFGQELDKIQQEIDQSQSSAGFNQSDDQWFLDDDNLDFEFQELEDFELDFNSLL